MREECKVANLVVLNGPASPPKSELYLLLGMKSTN
jgi:hypothetical protein